MMNVLLSQFNFDPLETKATPFGSGLINHTWLVTNKNKNYILQRINHKVFTNPGAIDDNINAINRYLKIHSPNYIFTAPIFSAGNKSLITLNENAYYRMFEFIEGSQTYTVLENPELAYEAARQFGRFTKLLSGFNIDELQITLPSFHDLNLRYVQFTEASKNSNGSRVTQSSDIIAALESYKYIVDIFNDIQQTPLFKKRVTHHDTKISNVLFTNDNKGICVIDLDTVMPGYFISDVGDMMRTYLSPAGEEETEYKKIAVREEYFDAIVQGYLSEMHNELSDEEKKYFIYAGKFMIYMQALRFITDYLNNDIYYGANYEQHNLHRAINQLTLLNIITNKEEYLTQRVASFINSSTKQRIIP